MLSINRLVNTYSTIPILATCDEIIDMWRNKRQTLLVKLKLLSGTEIFLFVTICLDIKLSICVLDLGFGMKRYIFRR